MSRDSAGIAFESLQLAAHRESAYPDTTMIDGARIEAREMSYLVACVLLCACSASGTDGASSGRASGAGTGGGALAADGGGTAGDLGTQIGGGDAGTAGVGASGASGAGGGPVLGNTPGTFTPRADLDPDAEFTWTESLPGQGTCMPGKYTGTFTCEYVMMGGMPGSGTMVSGPVTLELQKSMSGEFLEISNGELNGVAQGIFGFTAGLTGKLDCTTLEFEADAVMGTYGFGDPKLFPFGTFMGGLTGTFDDQSLTLSGEWALTENSGGTCKGPWMASYTP